MRRVLVCLLLGLLMCGLGVGLVCRPSVYRLDPFADLAVAGTGEFGLADGPAHTAQLNQPWGIALDRRGAIYVADYCNQRIRKISNGRVTTLAGSGTALDEVSGRMRPGVILAGGHVDGRRATARFAFPTDVATDSAGNLYVVDSHNDGIRKIAGDSVTTFAGSGEAGCTDGPALEAQFYCPLGLDVDPSGAVYVADSANHRVCRITDGRVTTLAGCGQYGHTDSPSHAAQFSSPHDVAVDDEGDVYVADTDSNRIRLISGTGVTTLAGSGNRGRTDGPAATAEFDGPVAVALGLEDTVYVADSDTVREIKDGTVRTLFSGLSCRGIAFDGQTTLYVAETGRNRILGLPLPRPTD